MNNDHKQPSKARGCEGKSNMGAMYLKSALRLAKLHGKTYGVYECPHCGGTHLTTKLETAENYKPLLFITPKGFSE